MSITKFNQSTDLDEVKVMLEEKNFWHIFLNATGKRNECTYIARYDNKISGFLSVNRFNIRRADITVYVDEKYRRNGIGTELLRFSDRFISGSKFEHAFCEFTADEGVTKFLTKNGYCSFFSEFKMERDNTLIDSDKLSDTSLRERDIIIRHYKNDDYMAWHNISDIAFFLMREKLGLTPSYYYPPSESDRKKFANDCMDRYVMVVDGVTTAIGIVTSNEIYLLAVRPDLQSHGYGRIMASYLNNEIITKRNAEKIKICVLNGNPAKNLYERLGFREVEFTYSYVKYYKPDSRQIAPKGYANKAEIMHELRLHGMLREEMIP